MKEKTIFVKGRQITYYRHPDLAGLPLRERRRITAKRWRKANPGMSSGGGGIEELTLERMTAGRARRLVLKTAIVVIAAQARVRLSCRLGPSLQ